MTEIKCEDKEFLVDENKQLVQNCVKFKRLFLCKFIFAGYILIFILLCADINNQKKQKIYYMISNTFRTFIWIMRCGMELKHFVLVEELKINLDYLVVLIQFSFWSQLSGTARYNRYNPLKSSSGNLNHLLKLHNNDLWYIYKIFMSRPILITLC